MKLFNICANKLSLSQYISMVYHQSHVTTKAFPYLEICEDQWFCTDSFLARSTMRCRETTSNSTGLHTHDWRTTISRSASFATNTN